MFRKLTIVSATVAALAVAVPAIAQADKGAKTPKSGKSHPTQSHKCQAHNRAYVESGTIDATTASTLASSSGTWSGTLVVDVKRTNHAAMGDKTKMQPITYTFTSAKLRVRFGHDVTGFTAGERVKLIGKIATVGKNCTPLNPAPTAVIGKVVVHRAAK